MATIFCIIFALWSALWFYSSVLTVRPEKVITQWEKKLKIVDETLLNRMITRLKLSLLLNPTDANTHFILARFYEQLAVTETDTDKKLQKYIQLAEYEYKKAISKQPSNGYLWAKLANFYSVTSQVDQVIFNALYLAIEYRKYERETQEVIIPLLLKYWDKLPNKIKNHSENLIRHAFKHRINASSLILQAKSTKTLTIINPLLTKKWHKDLVITYQKQLIKAEHNNEK